MDLRKILKPKNCKVFFLIIIIIVFISTNFFWKHSTFFGPGMATKYEGIGFPFLSQYEICGDVYICTGSKCSFSCNSFFELGKLFNNVIVWIIFYLLLVFLFCKEKIKKNGVKSIFNKKSNSPSEGQGPPSSRARRGTTDGQGIN